jgi:hypothetical protein
MRNSKNRTLRAACEKKSANPCSPTASVADIEHVFWYVGSWPTRLHFPPTSSCGTPRDKKALDFLLQTPECVLNFEFVLNSEFSPRIRVDFGPRPHLVADRSGS